MREYAGFSRDGQLLALFTCAGGCTEPDCAPSDDHPMVRLTREAGGTLRFRDVSDWTVVEPPASSP